MLYTFGSMATDMTSGRHRNLQWLNTSMNLDTPWNTLPSWSLKTFRIMTFNSEENVKDFGSMNSNVWHLRG